MRILILNWRDRLNPRSGGGDGLVHRVADYIAGQGHEVEMLASLFPGAKSSERVGLIRVRRIGGEIDLHFSVFLGRCGQPDGWDVVWDVINLLPWIRARRDTNRVRYRAMIHQLTYAALRLEINPLLASMGRLMEAKLTPAVYRDVPLVVLSQSVRHECVRLGFRSENVVAIPPGIDYEAHALEPCPDEHLRLLFIGRLRAYKGVQYLLQAMPLVLRRFPNARLDIVGRGPYQPHLMNLSRRLRVEHSVSFHGFVAEPGKLDLMRRSWMVLLPSIQEGWGIPIMEAAAAAVPAIGTDTSGLRDSIVQGSTGFLVPVGDARAIAEAIVRLAEDRPLREEFGRNAKRRAQAFDWSLQLPKYASFLLQEGRMPSA